MKIATRILLLALLASAAGPVFGATLPEGLQAQPYATLSGDTIRLEDFKGKLPVYLKFWATWCSTCMEEMPHLQSVYDDYGDRIAVLAVNLSLNDDLAAVTRSRDALQLTVPIVLDETGDLAQALGLAATPFHVLLDRDLAIVHQSYGATAELDDRIRRLSEDEPLAPVAPVKTEAPTQTPATRVASGGLSALFFIATWCNWYLADSRPEMAANCVSGQQAVNRLQRQFGAIEWIGVASRMWTGEKELAEYRQKFGVEHELWLDAANTVIQHYQVRDFPTLVLFRNGAEWLRIEDFSDYDQLSTMIGHGLAGNPAR